MTEQEQETKKVLNCRRRVQNMSRKQERNGTSLEHGRPGAGHKEGMELHKSREEHEQETQKGWKCKKSGRAGSGMEWNCRRTGRNKCTKQVSNITGGE